MFGREKRLCYKNEVIKFLISFCVIDYVDILVVELCTEVADFVLASTNAIQLGIVNQYATSILFALVPVQRPRPFA